jgi:hypothetical protein
MALISYHRIMEAFIEHCCGILQVAKAGWLSDINNLRVRTLLSVLG